MRTQSSSAMHINVHFEDESGLKGAVWPHDRRRRLVDQPIRLRREEHALHEKHVAHTNVANIVLPLDDSLIPPALPHLDEVDVPVVDVLSRRAVASVVTDDGAAGVVVLVPPNADAVLQQLNLHNQRRGCRHQSDGGHAKLDGIGRHVIGHVGGKTSLDQRV
mmetsp:Transcript_95495/g.187488  ORF Transcript_95495/g.187488 Transcript_95495/m.187488 type:complete len:162 (+) Transcript_95495:306-791(+)